MSDDSEKKSSGGVTDLARRLLLTGVGAIFMTEETIRKSLSELKLPTDAVGGVMDTIKRQKDDILEMVAFELSNFFTKIKVHEEIQKALRGMEVHLDAKISFDQKGDSKAAKVSIKRK